MSLLSGNNGYYLGQIKTLLSYIDSLIIQDWTDRDAEFRTATSIDKFAEVASMSRRNLQIVFQAYMGETLGAYKNRLRLEYAKQLLKTEDMPVSDIASLVGFANAPAFNNEFKKHYNVSPLECQAILTDNLSIENDIDLKYRIETLNAVPIIYISSIGNYDSLENADIFSDTWSQLEQYASENNLLDLNTEYWGIAFDDTDITEDSKCRFYSAITINPSSKTSFPLTQVIKTTNLPQGKYAVFTYKGDYKGLSKFYDSVLRHVEFEIADTPILERYINSSVDVTKSKLVTEVWVPVYC